MFANFVRAAFGAAVVGLLVLPTVASAQEGWDLSLTEAPEPDSKAWEDPARISLTIDPDGPDQFSAQVNLEAARNFALTRGRDGKVSGYVRWNRETGSDPQNNFEAGLGLEAGYDIGRLLNLEPADLRLPREQLARLADARERQWDVAVRSSAGYARKATYPDLSTPVCVATPALPQCTTQFSESLRTGLAMTLFNAGLENLDQRTGLVFSVQPKFGVDHDLLLNSPVNVDTGIAEHGGYLSALGGLAVNLSDSFINRGWEIQASAQLRQRLLASDSRRPSIERSAERFEISGTYYFIRPKIGESDFRAGIGVTYTHGEDPLTGAPKGDKIVVALRLGRY
ncbi:MAG TPA: hypothetical protein VIT45_13595 [Allosphingosinicella sp.]